MTTARTFLGHPRRLSRIVLIAVGLLLTGCAGGGSTAAAGPGQGDSGAPESGGDDSGTGPGLQVTLNIAGAATVHGSTRAMLPFTASGGQVSSCADYAKGSSDSSGNPMLELPSIIAAQPISGHRVLFTNQIKPYHGAGQYAKDALHGQGGGATVEIDDQAYALGATATAVTLIQPDGSGTLAFANFGNAQNGSTLSGSVMWTCTDH
jgi:uncharacterized spore protein YtfJ